MRRAAKVDANQPELVKLFRRLGFTVAHTHTAGAGFPDLVLGRRGVNYLVEIKDGTASARDRKLRPLQVEWHDAWRGQVVVIESVDQAIEWAAGLR